MLVTRAQPPSHLLYNDRETLDALRERQSGAYQTGTRAWREGLINGQALQLYNELVRCVGANRFAWIKEDTLAEQLGRSVSTIKRWMSQLVAGRLIQRGRRFGSSSLTYIVAYELSSDPEEQLSAPIDVRSCSSSDREHAPAAASEPLASSAAAQSATVARGPVAEDGSSCTDQPFFASTSEPSIGSFSRRHTIKSQHVKTQGGGTNPQMTELELIDHNEAIAKLRAEGVEDINVLRELQMCGIDEVECVIRYVARCRGNDDLRRPGLIVHLLRTGFGKRPGTRGDMGTHQTRSHRKRSGSRPAASMAGDPRRYSSEDLCPHGVYGVCPACRTSTETAASPDDVAAPPEQGVAPPVAAATMLACWPGVLARLAQEIAPDEFSVWLRTSCLLDIIDDLAIIGTPNVFVRDQVREVYGTRLVEALTAELGSPIKIEIVIDTPVVA